VAITRDEGSTGSGVDNLAVSSAGPTSTCRKSFRRTACSGADLDSKVDVLAYCGTWGGRSKTYHSGAVGIDSLAPLAVESKPKFAPGSTAPTGFEGACISACCKKYASLGDNTR
jgi:hypothetical protein